MKIVKMALIIVFALSFGIFGVSEVLALGSRDTSDPVFTSDRDVLEIHHAVPVCRIRRSSCWKVSLPRMQRMET